MLVMPKSFNGIDRIGFRANVNLFTHKIKKKDNAKNNIMLFFLVYIRLLKCFSSPVKLSPQIITAHNCVVHSPFEQY